MWCNQFPSDYLYYICRHFFLFVCCCYTLKMNFEFESVVCGYHHYQKYWSPKEHETLNCYHEPGNPFDIFAIKSCSHGSLQPVGHLPREISRLAKFILDRGAEVEAKLTSNQYRCSPITQGGLEIPCTVNIKMPATILNRNLLKWYKEMVSHWFAEPEESIMMGSFILDDIEEPEPEVNTSKKRQKKVLSLTTQAISHDIRSMLTCLRKVQSTNKSTVDQNCSEEKSVIVLDD